VNKRQALGEVKTSLYLPRAVWKAVKLRAARDRVSLREVILAALRAYLQPEKEGRTL
jgi:hypothetical protein